MPVIRHQIITAAGAGADPTTVMVRRVGGVYTTDGTAEATVTALATTGPDASHPDWAAGYVELTLAGEGTYQGEGYYWVSYLQGGQAIGHAIQVPDAGGPYQLLDLLIAAVPPDTVLLVPLAGLADTAALADATAGQVPTWDGAAWVPGSGGGGGGGVTDHGLLTGLGDDDHPHYLTTARGDARYYTETEADTLLAAKVPTARTLTAGTGLTGGGDLTADRALAVAYGAAAGTAAQGNDARLSDARTPTAHASTHASAGSDPVTPAAIGAAAASHAHAVADVTGLQAALDALPRLAATTQAGTSYTLALADAGTAVELTSGSAVSVTVPPNSAVAFPAGSLVELLQYGAGQVTVVAGSGVTIRTPGGSLTSRAQYSTLSLRKRSTGSDEWVLSGDAT